MGKPFGVWKCSDWKVPAATGKLQDIRNSWTSWTFDSLAFDTNDVSTRCQDTACSCLLQKANYFLLFVQGNHWNHLRKQMTNDKESRFESTLPNWSRLLGWYLDILDPTLRQVVVTFVLCQVVSKQRQHAWPRTQNFFQAVEAWRSLRMEIDFSTFGFKVDDLHGGDFFRDIGGQRHVSRVIHFFSGSKRLLFAGFQPEGVTSSDNTFWLMGW